MSAPGKGKPADRAAGNRLFISVWFNASMRAVLLLSLFALSGCAGAGVYAGVEVASVAVLGRGVGDLAVSAVTGRDCSIVRLDKGQTYCAARNQTPPPQPFCTRTLGTVNCWSDPGLLPPGQQEVADTPPPTEEQIRYRNARWPKSLFF